MSQFLAYINTTLVACAVWFVVGVLFSQKIKDWFHGVPSEVRAGLNQIEATVLGHITVTAQNAVKSVQAALPAAPPAAPKA
jgi:hypothetical protein